MLCRSHDDSRILQGVSPEELLDSRPILVRSHIARSAPAAPRCVRSTLDCKAWSGQSGAFCGGRAVLHSLRVGCNERVQTFSSWGTASKPTPRNARPLLRPCCHRARQAQSKQRAPPTTPSASVAG